MTTQYTIDLTRPGQAQRSRWDWFVGSDGQRHLVIVAVAGIAVVLIVALGGLLPRYLKYSKELQTITKLRRDVVTSSSEIGTLRASLKDLGAEARRQVRWSELLPVFSRRVPDTLRIDRVSLVKASGRALPAGVQAGDLVLEIAASTTVVPGSSRLNDVASFMAGVAQEPAIANRFEMKTWEVKPNREGSESQIVINVAFAEKRS